MKGIVIVTCLFCAILLAAMSADGAESGPPNKGDAQHSLDKFAEMIGNGEIERMEILSIPASISTRAGVTPEFLEKNYYFKLTITNPEKSRHGKSLIQALTRSGAKTGTDKADLRWGIHLYGPGENDIGAVYVDKFGRVGMIGSIPVSFEGDIFGRGALSKWLKGAVADCFR